jgi:hypothetical protein
VRGPDEFEQTFPSRAQAGWTGWAAWSFSPIPMLNSHRVRLAELSAKHRLPSISPFRDAARSGGLTYRER